MAQSVRHRADEAHEMAADAVAVTQAQGFILGALLAVLRDTAVLPRATIANIFLGAATVIDKTPADDDATKQSLAASRDYVAQMAQSFGTTIPDREKATLPYRN